MGLVVEYDGWEIPDALWQEMEPLLPKAPSPKDHPLRCHRSRVDNRHAMNAILFKLRTGCQWAALKRVGRCSSSTAHRRLQEWAQAGVFEQFWRLGLLAYEELKGIDWTCLSMDGAITKAPLGGEKTGPNPTDRAKGGTKRSLLTDGKGIPLAVAVDGANRNDFKMARATLEGMLAERPAWKSKRQHLCLDKGYDYRECREIVREFNLTPHIRSRGQEAEELKKSPGKKARRWVAERSHSWINRFRNLLTRWEKKEQNYTAMLHLALGIITWRSTGLLG